MSATIPRSSPVLQAAVRGALRNGKYQQLTESISRHFPAMAQSGPQSVKVQVDVTLENVKAAPDESIAAQMDEVKMCQRTTMNDMAKMPPQKQAYAGDMSADTNHGLGIIGHLKPFPFGTPMPEKAFKGLATRNYGAFSQDSRLVTPGPTGSGAAADGFPNFMVDDMRELPGALMKTAAGDKLCIGIPMDMILKGAPAKFIAQFNRAMQETSDFGTVRSGSARTGKSVTYRIEVDHMSEGAALVTAHLGSYTYALFAIVASGEKFYYTQHYMFDTDARCDDLEASWKAELRSYQNVKPTPGHSMTFGRMTNKLVLFPSASFPSRPGQCRTLVHQARFAGGGTINMLHIVKQKAALSTKPRNAAPRDANNSLALAKTTGVAVQARDTVHSRSAPKQGRKVAATGPQ